MNISRAAKISELVVAGKAKPKRQEGMRETIEAVAIAFILAFVFKTFEAEAFVIPTGSMAPDALRSAQRGHLYGMQHAVHDRGKSGSFSGFRSH